MGQCYSGYEVVKPPTTPIITVDQVLCGVKDVDKKLILEDYYSMLTELPFGTHDHATKRMQETRDLSLQNLVRFFHGRIRFQASRGAGTLALIEGYKSFIQEIETIIKEREKKQSS